jgi:E3 ubiquitin-protein ligase RGLG
VATRTFLTAGQCLHSIRSGTNPYMTVMSIVCKTLSAFDDDHMIPAYGFGDTSARQTAVFSFASGNQPIHTLENVLKAYTALTQKVKLSGPTSFAPAIYQALHIVKNSGGRYHVLVIIADGQVCARSSLGTEGCLKRPTESDSAQ